MGRSKLAPVTQLFDLQPTDDDGGTLGDPPVKPKLAAPYNLKATRDPAECKLHAPGEYEQKCLSDLEYFGAILVWDYNRYGKCNPQSEVCDLSYQPAKSFLLHTIRDGIETVYHVYIEFGGYSYTPAYTLEGKEIYYVTSYDEGIGESEPSEKVPYPWFLQETYRAPEELLTSRYIIKQNTGIPPYWDTYPAVGAWELISGYAFGCKNSCSQGELDDSWWVGSAKFELPPLTGYVSGVLRWVTKGYVTSGAGADDVEKSCHVFIALAEGGYALPDANYSLYGLEKYDVRREVKQAYQGGRDTIEFLFTPPMDRQSGVRWDRCLWDIENLGLVLYSFK